MSEPVHSSSHAHVTYYVTFTGVALRECHVISDMTEEDSR